MGDPAPAGFGFRGRIGRAQYWAQMLVVVLGVGLMRQVVVALAFLNSARPSDNGPTINSSARGSAWRALSRMR
jgi:uncharacterized membrane protein YhaH (DUF805 family)